MSTGTVRPLGPHVANQCAVRVQYDVLPPDGIERGRASVTSRGRMDDAQEHQRTVLTHLVALHPKAVVIDAGPDAVEQTRAALAQATKIIVGPMLPQDLIGGRTGQPALLLRVGAGYVPVDIHWHGVPAKDSKATLQVSTLPDPLAQQVLDGRAFRADKLVPDGFRLAHHWRILEALGLTDGDPRGAIIDRHEQIIWVDLAAAPKNGSSLLDQYDAAFEHRRAIVAQTELRLVDPGLERAVLPMAIKACAACPWTGSCQPELESQDHLSLLAGFKGDWHRAFQERGVGTRRHLAGLDLLTAQVVAGLTPSMLARAESAPSDVRVAELFEKRPGVLTVLKADGIADAGTLRGRLHGPTLSFRGTSAAGSLPGLIDTARAVVSGGHFRVRGSGPLDLSPAAVEIDVDMESSTSSHNYLWGTLICIDGVRGDYLPFDTYEPATDETEAAVFVRFWDWLGEQRKVAAGLGGALRLYYWTSAELTAMRRVVGKQAAPGLPASAELEASIAAEWIDLAAVWKRHVFTGLGYSLKPVAQSIGFAWEPGDTGGDFSMIQHQIAVEADEPERTAARDWIRRYNRDDVTATYEVRRWLRERVDTLPRIEDWTG